LTARTAQLPGHGAEVAWKPRVDRPLSPLGRCPRPYAAAMGDEHLIETTVGREVLHRGRFITFRIDTIEDPEGRRHTREVVEHPGAVCVLPILGDDVLMVRQFRTPIEQVLLELPAGKLDHQSDGTVEDPDRAAPRELAEETGFHASSWRKLGSFWSAPGFTDELMHLYLATELAPLENYTGPDEDEYLDLVRLPWRDAVAMAESGEISDAKSLVGLLRLARLADAGPIA
jgi:ADP-ribose pyrophosphatase